MADHRVVIVGGGFGGLYAVRALSGAPVSVTLVDRRNFHLFQPLLYQVATGALSPANIAKPLRSILAGQANARVLMAEVRDFDLDRRVVHLDTGDIEYDSLVVASGSEPHYFSHDDWQAVAPGLKTVEDALEMRRRIFLAFEEAERSPGQRPGLLTFVVVGGGPTGVELAGALAEIATTIVRDYRTIRAKEVSIVLIEAAARVLPSYPNELSRKAELALRKLGVEVRTGASVAAIDAQGLDLTSDGQSSRLPASTVLWAAGVRSSSLGTRLAKAAGIETDRQGRLAVGPQLNLQNHPEVFVVGDLAHVEQDGAPLPAVAPVAMQEGRHAANVIRGRLSGIETPAFRYRDRGAMATIGRSAAVADLGLIKLSGFVGWLTWLFIHLLYLAGFENRLLVLTQWAWNYFGRNRSARLITRSEATEKGSGRL
ncbi:MAG: NAD(P)/FAD-dependent oxidoreductase [Dehalococcoidia bacterium]|nr:NAD(P)/FAD-dependent oxidoreductase [Dehalococcoidia bacterium]